MLPYTLQMIGFLAIYAILVGSVEFSAGKAGMICLHYAALFGIGAYAAAAIARTGVTELFVTVAAAAAAAVLAGCVIAACSRRARGDHLVLGLLGIQIILSRIMLNLDWATGGPSGIAGIPAPSLLGVSLTRGSGFIAVLVLVAAAIVVGLAALRQSAFGLALQGTRDCERLMLASGYNTALLRYLALAISSVSAGVAGALYSHYVGYIDPSSFDLRVSIMLLAAAIAGGLEKPLSPVLGAFVFVTLPELLRFAGIVSAKAPYIQECVFATIVLAFVVRHTLVEARTSAIASRGSASQ